MTTAYNRLESLHMQFFQKFTLPKKIIQWKDSNSDGNAKWLLQFTRKRMFIINYNSQHIFKKWRITYQAWQYLASKAYYSNCQEVRQLKTDVDISA